MSVEHAAGGDVSPCTGGIKKLNSKASNCMIHTLSTSGRLLESCARDDFLKLRYNSYITKFTPLKCAIEWLYYSHRVMHLFSESNFRIVSSPSKRKPFLIMQSRPILSSSQPLAITNTLSASMDLPILEMSHGQNHTSCGVPCLASFPRHNVVKAHPCCSMDWYFIPFSLVQSFFKLDHILLHGYTTFCLLSHQL